MKPSSRGERRQEEARRQINPRDGWIPEEPGTRWEQVQRKLHPRASASGLLKIHSRVSAGKAVNVETLP